jgi:tetratricopeptide (TPR) repeat protein
MENISSKYVLTADKMLREGNYKEAIEFISRGVEQYPEYAVGYALLTEAYELSGDSDSAKIIFDGAKNIFPTNKLLNMIEKRFIQNKYYSLISPKQNAPTGNIFGKFQSSISQTGFVKPRPEEIPEEIEDLTQHNPDAPVTESLAQILANQGRIDESIDMYFKLMNQFPEKTDDFVQKIDALKHFSQNG